MAPKTTGHNLIQIITSMRNFGIGVNVRRSVWSNPGCYWKITRCKLKPSSPYSYGKVWGVFHWNHKQIGTETKIGGTHKKQWLLDLEQPPELSEDGLRSLLPRRPAKKTKQAETPLP
mmetsp:Transcript_15215/g.20394  ORF Transcript_15215/g.20394 Transcript_15215/m.20394 type:complete len:117 (-) Transcript_15215:379-729(-)